MSADGDRALDIPRSTGKGCRRYRHCGGRLRLETARAAQVTRADFQVEQRVIRQGGEVTWLHFRGRRKHDNPECQIGISLDITERK